MSRAALEIAGIFRDHGSAWRRANAGHVSLPQMKVMTAIERCRTAALGGHVARCENNDCGHTVVAYNSCRNRHCPKCQGAAARDWLQERQAELLPVPYFHVVYTLPGPIADLAYQNKAVIYDILFKASAEATLAIAADPKRLGARIGITSVLHTWGSAMTHHPHVHMIVPGGGLSEDGERWIACRPNFFLPVRVLSRLFRRLVIEMLIAAHDAGKLVFFGAHASLVEAQAFAAFLSPLERCEWVVYSKRPFAGPEAVLAYLSRYTHRVAISNRRLLAADANAVTFKYKDYRLDGPGRFKTMTLATPEFIRRFLVHVLPKGFHRIRHYGLFANGNRADNVAKARQLLAVPAPLAEPEPQSTNSDEPAVHACPCPCCGGRMLVIEVFARGCEPQPPADARRDRDRHLMRRLSHRATIDPIRRLGAGNEPTRLVQPDYLTETPAITRARCFARHPPDLPAGSAAYPRPRASPPALQQGSNPHRASLTAAASPPAISCLGASRTPSARASRTPTSRRPRNLHQCGPGLRQSIATQQLPERPREIIGYSDPGKVDERVE